MWLCIRIDNKSCRQIHVCLVFIRSSQEAIEAAVFKASHVDGDAVVVLRISSNWELLGKSSDWEIEKIKNPISWSCLGKNSLAHETRHNFFQSAPSLGIFLRNHRAIQSPDYLLRKHRAIEPRSKPLNLFKISVLYFDLCNLEAILDDKFWVRHHYLKQCKLATSSSAKNLIEPSEISDGEMTSFEWQWSLFSNVISWPWRIAISNLCSAEEHGHCIKQPEAKVGAGSSKKSSAPAWAEMLAVFFRNEQMHTHPGANRAAWTQSRLTKQRQKPSTRSALASIQVWGYRTSPIPSRSPLNQKRLLAMSWLPSESGLRSRLDTTCSKILPESKDPKLRGYGNRVSSWSLASIKFDMSTPLRPPLYPPQTCAKAKAVYLTLLLRRDRCQYITKKLSRKEPWFACALSQKETIQVSRILQDMKLLSNATCTYFFPPSCTHQALLVWDLQALSQTASTLETEGWTKGRGTEA